ncbi:MAG: hypothetical protein PHY56_03290 [Candidatus Omnitrophica bacterium]|jgi:hypothetical protein|nr:hypothetical protein [Candidatus Omnitrophota bacterium]
MKYLFKKIQEITKFLVRGVQGLLLVVFLTILYFFGFGITLFLLSLFNRKALNKKYNSDPTFWDIAEGYDADIDNSLRQS